jgi:hypothetical protein
LARTAATRAAMIARISASVSIGVTIVDMQGENVPRRRRVAL